MTAYTAFELVCYMIAALVAVCSLALCWTVRNDAEAVAFVSVSWVGSVVFMYMLYMTHNVFYSGAVWFVCEFGLFAAVLMKVMRHIESTHQIPPVH